MLDSDALKSIFPEKDPPAIWSGPGLYPEHIRTRENPVANESEIAACDGVSSTAGDRRLPIGRQSLYIFPPRPAAVRYSCK